MEMFLFVLRRLTWRSSRSSGLSVARSLCLSTQIPQMHNEILPQPFVVALRLTEEDVRPARRLDTVSDQKGVRILCEQALPATQTPVHFPDLTSEFPQDVGNDGARNTRDINSSHVCGSAFPK